MITDNTLFANSSGFHGSLLMSSTTKRLPNDEV